MKRDMHHFAIDTVKSGDNSLFEMKFKKIRIIASASLALVVAASNAQAAVLIFKNADGEPLPYDTPVPVDYGDNILTSIQGSYSYGIEGGATQNVTVNYDPSDNIRTFPGGYGNLASVIYVTSGSFAITFTADAGYEVQLTSFNLAGYGRSENLGSVTVSNGINTYTQENLSHDGSSTSSTAVNFSGGLAAASGQVVTLSFAGTTDYMGFSDFKFSQVPAPKPDFFLTITPNAQNVGYYNFSWDTQLGKSYDLVSSTALATAQSNWDVWQGNVNLVGTGGTYNLTNIDGGANTKRFFAVRQKTPTP